MKLKPVALSLSQSEIDEIATELLEAMQPDWQNAVRITPSTLPYTMPSDGIFIGRGISATSGSITIYINGVNISDTNSGYTNFQVSVKKNDIARMIGSLAGGGFTFVPYKTMNPVSLRPLDPHKIDTAILNHWDDITSDFSIPGSTAGAVLSSVKYNPVLQQLKLIIKKTTSTAASTSFKLYLQYNGSEPITFGDNTILLWNHVGPANGVLAGMEYGIAVIASNKFQINVANRNSGDAWAANDIFRGIIWL